MPSKFRKMHTYHPRRSSKVLKERKKELADLGDLVKNHLGELLTHLEKGSPDKVEVFSQKTEESLTLLGPDMEKLAQEIGAPFPKAVHAFLDSVDKVLFAQKNSTPSPFYLWVDENKIKTCHKATARLEKVLRK